MHARKILKKIILSMPKSLRWLYFQSILDLPESIDTEIEFTIAKTEQELEQSFHLLYKAYRSVGLQGTEANQLRITPYHALPSTTTLIAKNKNSVIATVSVVADNPLGLPADEVVSLDLFRNRGKRIVEVSALAIDKNYRGKLLFPLLKYMYQYCIDFFGADILIATITTPSRAHEFYESILQFKPVTSNISNSYAFANNIPVIVEYLDLHEAKYNYASKYGHRPKNKDLFSFFTRIQFQNFVFPKRTYYYLEDPVMTHENICKFYSNASKLVENLSDEKKARLLTSTKDESLMSIFSLKNKKGLENMMERPPRFAVRCPAKILAGENNSANFYEVRDVSRNGFRLKFNPGEVVPDILNCKIRIADFEVVQLKSKRTWWNPTLNEAGYQILTGQLDIWNSYLDHLEGMRTHGIQLDSNFKKTG